MDKRIVASILIVSTFILGGSIFFLSKNSSSEVKTASYKVTDQQKPKAELWSNLGNLGEMKVSDEKSFDFTVVNSGNKPLQISNVTTSCGCTVARVIVGGKMSEEFGMHTKSSYIAEVPPKGKAIIRAVYRPFVMPVYGPVEREVYADTNDPLNPKLIFKVAADVK